MRIFTQAYLPLFLLLSFGSCIKEDFSGCPSGIRVYFNYESTYTGTGIDPSDVDKINLYVFDAEGILRTVVEDKNPNFSDAYYMTVESLPAGEYRFAAWLNLYGCFSTSPDAFTVGETTFDQSSLIFAHTDEASVIGQPLFFAHLSRAGVSTGRDQRFYLPVEQTTNTINLTTEGLPSHEDTYRLIIMDNNGIYKFDHSFATDSEFTYTTLCDKDTQGQPTAELTVLRLAANRHPVIKLYNVSTQTVRYTGNLMELLNARGVDYYSQHEFDIHLKFNARTDVEVIIDGWQVTNGGIILK